jgi:hypothetical protein
MENFMQFQLIDNMTIAVNAEYPAVFNRVKEAVISLNGKVLSEDLGRGEIEAKWKYGINFYGLRVEVKFATIQDKTIQIAFNGFFKDAADTTGACNKKCKELIDAVVAGNWMDAMPPKLEEKISPALQLAESTVSTQKPINNNQIVIAAIITMAAIFIYFNSNSGVDIYDALINRIGMQKDDPKLESKKILGQCTIEGKKATLGVVTFSYSLMRMGGINKREMFSPMLVAALENNNGEIVTVIGEYENEAQSEAVKNKWVNFWGCKIE